MDPSENLQLSDPRSLAHNPSQSLQNIEILDVEAEQAPHLLDYWRLVLKRRWTVSVCLLIVFSTVAIGTLKKTPIYEGKVTLEIDPEQPQVLNFREVAQSAPTVDVDSYRETQYKILQSRSLAERVVRDLQLYRVPEFYKNRMLFGLITSNPDKIPSPSELAPDPNSDAFRNAVGYLLRSVDVSPVRRSNLVEVSADCESPQLAQQIANKLADDYIEQNLQAGWDESAKASDWLQGRLTELKVKLEKADDELQQYAQRNSIVFITDKQTMVNERLQELLQAYTAAQAQRFQKEALYSLVQKGEIENLPGVMDNRLVQDLQERKFDLEKQYAEITTWVKPDYPKAREIQKQMDAIQAQIDKQAQAVARIVADGYHSALAQEQSLQKAVETQKQEVNNIAAKSVQYNILKRDSDSYRQLYDGLLQRMKEARVSSGLDASNIRVVDAAELPKGPSKPRVPLNMMLGIVAGLGLGVGLAFFQEYLDRSLKTQEDVETLLRLPSLGILPRFHANGNGKDEMPEAIVPQTHALVAPYLQNAPEAIEAFRSLRTSILLSANPVPRLILVTSSLPGEGKTTTTLNLGATLASLGSKVVIVDCDMRKPNCHRAAGVSNASGFVQCLTGQLDVTKALLPVPGVGNLSVIPCGPIPPNPAELLSSPATAECLHRLRGLFDYVLVDSPPLLSVADSRILATLTDAAVLVTRAFETPYDVVRRGRTLLHGAGARILGVALNDVDLHKHRYGPDSYYRYGYGEYESDSSRESGPS